MRLATPLSDYDNACGLSGDQCNLRRRQLIAAAFGLTAAGLLVTACVGGTTLSYRLTATVLVAGERVSGTGVRRLFWHQRVQFAGPLDRSGFTTRGDAVVVDLGARGVLFVTLAPLEFNPQKDRWAVDSGVWKPEAAFRRAFGADVHSWRRHEGETVRLKRGEMPLLVAFTSRQDPGSVREVDPQNLSASFGPSVRLEAITVEIARSAVTRGEAQKWLPWLGDADALGPSERLQPLSGGRATLLPQQLVRHHFRAGGG